MDDKSERGRAEARRSFREEALDCVNLEKLFRVVVRHLFDLFTEEQGGYVEKLCMIDVFAGRDGIRSE